MRQLSLHTPEMQDSQQFRKILLDDLRRRHYVIDADVKSQTMDLMRCPPSPDSQGRVKEERFGGMRRIDRILVRTGNIAGYAFISALAGATDHVPVVTTLDT